MASRVMTLLLFAAEPRQVFIVYAWSEIGGYAKGITRNEHFGTCIFSGKSTEANTNLSDLYQCLFLRNSPCLRMLNYSLPRLRLQTRNKGGFHTFLQISSRIYGLFICLVITQCTFKESGALSQCSQ